jgi:amino acid transporter
MSKHIVTEDYVHYKRRKTDRSSNLFGIGMIIILACLLSILIFSPINSFDLTIGVLIPLIIGGILIYFGFKQRLKENRTLRRLEED